MEAGLLAVGHASLKLSPVAGLVTRNLLQITDLKTDPDHQHKGEATRLMSEACRRADMSTFILILKPEPFNQGPLSAKNLERWYETFGFKRIQDRPAVLMCREPKRKVWNIDTDEVVEVGGH